MLAVGAGGPPCLPTDLHLRDEALVLISLVGASAPTGEREWRNWQTRTVQVRVPVRAWGFKSPLAHHGSSLGRAPEGPWQTEVVSHYNDRIIAEYRENGGRVQNFGSSLVLLHTIGARSGEARVSPVLAIADGDAWLVIASAGGSPRHPAWYFNLVAHPDVAVETPGGTVGVHATVLEGADYDTAWPRFVARSAAFEQYKERTDGRTMPILRLDPR